MQVRDLYIAQRRTGKSAFLALKAVQHYGPLVLVISPTNAMRHIMVDAVAVQLAASRLDASVCMSPVSHRIHSRPTEIVYVSAEDVERFLYHREAPSLILIDEYFVCTSLRKLPPLPGPHIIAAGSLERWDIHVGVPLPL